MLQSMIKIAEIQDDQKTNIDYLAGLLNKLDSKEQTQIQDAVEEALMLQFKKDVRVKLTVSTFTRDGKEHEAGTEGVLGDHFWAQDDKTGHKKKCWRVIVGPDLTLRMFPRELELVDKHSVPTLENSPIQQEDGNNRKADQEIEHQAQHIAGGRRLTASDVIPKDSPMLIVGGPPFFRNKVVTLMYDYEPSRENRDQYVFFNEKQINNKYGWRREDVVLLEQEQRKQEDVNIALEKRI